MFMCAAHRSIHVITSRKAMMWSSTRGRFRRTWIMLRTGTFTSREVLRNTPHVRYAGSIERMNYGEWKDDKSVVLVDIGPDGRRGDPVCLPLNATPIYRIEILHPDTDMQGLRERYPDHADALVSYRLVFKPRAHNPYNL